jgi:hypothetical protein
VLLTAFAVMSTAVAGVAFGFAVFRTSSNQTYTWQQDMFGYPCGPGAGYAFWGNLYWDTCQISWVNTADVSSRNGWLTTVTNAANDWATYDSSRSRWDFKYYGPDHCDAYSNDPNCQAVIADTADLGPRDPNTGLRVDGTGKINYAVCPTGQSSCTIILGEVTISTNSTISWYVDSLGGSIGSGQIDLQAMTEHEFGHVLGLAHPVANDSGGYKAVMECALTAGVIRRITSDDRNGVLWLYSGHPSDFGAPVNSPC